MPDKPLSDLPDGFESYYADKLWSLLPAIYRIADTPDLDSHGPLREMVERIGAQAAILRRSLDRLWEDQSIETCDDWVIPYLGALVGTQLVQNLDPRGQRLDVAHTIDYRRRKGTVGLLEQLAADIAGWDAHVVEFFQRLARTHHNLDPDGGRLLRPAPAGAGGWADIRNANTAAKTDTAFDSVFHAADVRIGPGQSGRYHPSALGVFLLRLKSFPAGQTTPVQDAEDRTRYTFDPTGRDIPLFAASARAYGEAWVTSEEWRMPGRISRRLLEESLPNLYAGIDPGDGVSVVPNSLAIFHRHQETYRLVMDNDVGVEGDEGEFAFVIDPARGRLRHCDSRSSRYDLGHGSRIRVAYHYGAVSEIGAGPYDRRSLGKPPVETPGRQHTLSGGGERLEEALEALAETGRGTITLEDSLTYHSVHRLEGVRQVTVRAGSGCRPVVRLPRPEPEPRHWIFEGLDEDSALTLDGLLVSGGDVVLRGTFGRVTLHCCTFDPGNGADAPGEYARSADGRDLMPCRLQIEGRVGELTLDRCITGPILAGPDAEVEVTTMTDGIVQAINADGGENAVGIGTGIVRLSRCAVLGPVAVSRLEASECLLHEAAQVQDVQAGCVRFSAYADGSRLPTRFASLALPPRFPLFVSREFGHPAYGQLAQGVDAAISEGAEDGSAMGAFARERNAIKERGLRLKYAEYLPLGLTPVFVYVT